jgi:Family of unknown function (DUF5683)
MLSSTSNTLINKENTRFKITILKFVLILLPLFCISSSAISQVTDSTQKNITKKEIAKNHSPKLAALMSTILPGAGQVYNKKYWKVPVIYAGLIALAYSIDFNEKQYNIYRVAYKCRLDTDSRNDRFVGIYRDSDLNTLQKTYNRYRDLSVIGASLLYILNIVDATVDAHLFSFDVSDDLSFRMQPTLINTVYSNQYTTGISLNIKF